ncbi:cell surface antigen I/II [Striga asiatica]|uniref:Cell surface antigen I/II n=1 Tax=Striga asiatica TaxID=4170 RepID=A0A5A7P746_STRAF|nr:cell surface antigen I/II [Striga asiatica]
MRVQIQGLHPKGSSKPRNKLVLSVDVLIFILRPQAPPTSPTPAVSSHRTSPSVQRPRRPLYLVDEPVEEDEILQLEPVSFEPPFSTPTPTPQVGPSSNRQPSPPASPPQCESRLILMRGSAHEQENTLTNLKWWNF